MLNSIGDSKHKIGLQKNAKNRIKRGRLALFVMKDLQNARLLWVKGILLLLIGSVSATLILVEAPSIRVGILLALTIWGFCRAYYFAFYVISNYVDPGYRFSGLWSFCAYCLRRKTNPPDRSY
jgi:hypothetical protein